MVEMLDLLTEDKVLEQSRASLADAQTVLVGDRTANVGGHEGASVVDIELRQEFLRLRGSTVAVAVGIAVVSTMKGSFTRQLARQVRASCTGDTRDGRKEAQRPHYGRFFSIEYEQSLQTAAQAGDTGVDCLGHDAGL